MVAFLAERLAQVLQAGACAVEWVPCFTAFRLRAFTECWHAYVWDGASKKSREHVF